MVHGQGSLDHVQAILEVAAVRVWLSRGGEREKGPAKSAVLILNAESLYLLEISILPLLVMHTYLCPHFS